MTSPAAVVPLLVFEAADCLMAVVASEVGHLEKRLRDGVRPLAPSRERVFDLGTYFDGAESGGPWLEWARGDRNAWLRVGRVIDVVPVPLAGLTPMPALLGGEKRTNVFLAAGVQNDEVFLLLDPARLES